MAESIPHIFQAVQAATKKEKVNVLRQLGNEHVRKILQHAFHPGIKFLLPAGTPPYVFRGTPEGFPTTLYPEVRKFYIFCEGGLLSTSGKRPGRDSDRSGFRIIEHRQVSRHQSI